MCSLLKVGVLHAPRGAGGRARRRDDVSRDDRTRRGPVPRPSASAVRVLLAQLARRLGQGIDRRQREATADRDARDRRVGRLGDRRGPRGGSCAWSGIGG
jgi:hypothetical protein